MTENPIFDLVDLNSLPEDKLPILARLFAGVFGALSNYVESGPGDYETERGDLPRNQGAIGMDEALESATAEYWRDPYDRFAARVKEQMGVELPPLPITARSPDSLGAVKKALYEFANGPSKR